MTDPMLTGNPATVTIEGSLRIIDLSEKVFYSCISRLLVLWDFLLKTIGLIKKIVKNKRIKMSTTENFEKKQNAVVVKRRPGREEALVGQKQFFLPCKGF